MYNMNILGQTACMVVNLIMVENFASLFNCTKVSSDKMTAPSSIHSDPVCGFLFFWIQFAIEPFALLHHCAFDYTCFILTFHKWGRGPLWGPNTYIFVAASE